MTGRKVLYESFLLFCSETRFEEAGAAAKKKKKKSLKI